MSDHFHIDSPSIQPDTRMIKQEAAAAKQLASDESFEMFCEEAFNPWAADADRHDRFKTLEDRSQNLRVAYKKAQHTQAVNRAENSARQFQMANHELDQQKLLKFLNSLKNNSSMSDILDQAAELFEDAYLQDEALRFLTENCSDELLTTVKEAKEELQKRAGTQIVAGRNIKQHTNEFAKAGLGSPVELRELYQDITVNPRETDVLFEELAKNYTYTKLKTVIQFLLHSLGSDLRAKGPSIPRGELARLFTETRSLQTILGIYRFFQSRMKLVGQMFKNEEIKPASPLSFESLAKLFIKLVQDKFPSSVKILRSASQLEPEEKVAALLIIISQWRDAVRNVSPRLYKSTKQRDDLLNAIIEALEELEEQEEERRRRIIEEEEEEEARKRKEKDKKS